MTRGDLVCLECGTKASIILSGTSVNNLLMYERAIILLMDEVGL